MTPDLVLSHGSAEGFPPGTVFKGLADGIIHRRQGADRGRKPLALEVVHDVVEAFVQFAEHEAPVDTAFIKEQLGRVRRQIANLAELLSY